ncbi:MAG: hypothetical protein ACREPQ_00400 [Rhodanobacter sp.]
MVDASTMLGNLITSFPGLVTLVNLLASLAGLAIVFIGIYKFTELKPKGDQRLVTAIMWVFSGVALINLASSIETGLVTVFGSSANVHSLMAYSSTSGMSQASQQLIQVLIMCARLYGLVAAIRGIMTLRHVGDPGYREGNAFKSGLMKFVFGCILLNIVQAVSVVATTFGWGQPLG